MSLVPDTSMYTFCADPVGPYFAAERAANERRLQAESLRAYEERLQRQRQHAYREELRQKAEQLAKEREEAAAPSGDGGEVEGGGEGGGGGEGDGGGEGEPQ